MQCSKCAGTGDILDGRAARKLRESKKVGLVEVATKMGISPSYLCDLERDRKDWNHDLETRFKKALK